ncbi:uncharacterized protein METZ01_LOCUS245675, partial [marine metagenome]
VGTVEVVTIMTRRRIRQFCNILPLGVGESAYDLGCTMVSAVVTFRKL